MLSELWFQIPVKPLSEWPAPVQLNNSCFNVVEKVSSRTNDPKSHLVNLNINLIPALSDFPVGGVHHRIHRQRRTHVCNCEHSLSRCGSKSADVTDALCAVPGDTLKPDTQNEIWIQTLILLTRVSCSWSRPARLQEDRPRQTDSEWDLLSLVALMETWQLYPHYLHHEHL